MTTIEQRIELYKQYKEAYYLGEPLISDEEFDLFEESLIEDGFDPIVGYQEISKDKKVSHRNKMLSLGKHKVLGNEMPIELANELFAKYGHGTLSWKYDGLALEAQYTDGQLGLICTRGNGLVGQNVTEKMRHLFPQRLNYAATIDIRCELVMNQRVYERKWSKLYAHSRNLVAGICNDINSNDERKYDLSIAVLEAIENGNMINPSSYHPVLEQNYKEHFECNCPEDIKRYFDKCIINRMKFDFGVDGMVYTSKVSKFLHNGHHPEFAIAIKFSPPILQSIITNITWKLHKTGRYVPKIHFTPIIVDGREIKQASGHNIEYLVKHDLTIGKIVNVVLSNDIIPAIKPIKTNYA